MNLRDVVQLIDGREFPAVYINATVIGGTWWLVEPAKRPGKFAEDAAALLAGEKPTGDGIAEHWAEQDDYWIVGWFDTITGMTIDREEDHGEPVASRDALIYAGASD